MNLPRFSAARTTAGTFRALAEKDPPPARRSRGQARTHRLFRGEGGFEVAISHELTESIIVLARRAAPDEMYAKLAGTLYTDDEGDHLVVCGVVEDTGALASPGAVRSTELSELDTRTLLDRAFPTARLVGWLHSHPGGPVAYSSVDVDNQRAWRKPWQIGLLVALLPEPTIIVYRGPDAERLVEVGSDRGAVSSVPRQERTRTAKRPTHRGRGEAKPSLIHLAALVVCLQTTLVAIIAGRFLTSLPPPGEDGPKHPDPAVLVATLSLSERLGKLEAQLETSQSRERAWRREARPEIQRTVAPSEAGSVSPPSPAAPPRKLARPRSPVIPRAPGAGSAPPPEAVSNVVPVHPPAPAASVAPTSRPAASALQE